MGPYHVQTMLTGLTSLTKTAANRVVSHEVYAQNKFMYLFGDNSDNSLLFTSNVKAHFSDFTLSPNSGVLVPGTVGHQQSIGSWLD